MAFNISNKINARIFILALVMFGTAFTSPALAKGFTFFSSTAGYSIVSTEEFNSQNPTRACHATAKVLTDNNQLAEMIIYQRNVDEISLIYRYPKSWWSFEAARMTVTFDGTEFYSRKVDLRRWSPFIPLQETEEEFVRLLDRIEQSDAMNIRFTNAADIVEIDLQSMRKMLPVLSECVGV